MVKFLVLFFQRSALIGQFGQYPFYPNFLDQALHMSVLSVFHLLHGKSMKNYVSGFSAENEHKKMILICHLKAFFFNDSPLASYGIAYFFLVTWLREIKIVYFSAWAYTVQAETPNKVCKNYHVYNICQPVF